MFVNPAIRNMIREGKVPQIDAAIQTGRADGMTSMDLSLAQLSNDGLISRDDAIQYSFNLDVLSRYLKEE